MFTGANNVHCAGARSIIYAAPRTVIISYNTYDDADRVAHSGGHDDIVSSAAAGDGVCRGGVHVQQKITKRRGTCTGVGGILYNTMHPVCIREFIYIRHTGVCTSREKQRVSGGGGDVRFTRTRITIRLQALDTAYYYVCFIHAYFYL